MTAPTAISLLLADMRRDRRPLLTAAGERRLAKRIQAGGPDGDTAARELVERNLRWAVRLAKGFRERGLDFEDLISASVIGLTHAARRFDPDKGRFTTVATWWCRHQLHDALRQTSRPIRLPANVYAELQKIRRAERDLIVTTSAAITSDLLAARTGLTRERVDELQEIDRQQSSPASLNAPVGEDGLGAAELGDLLPDTNAPGPLDVTEATLQSEVLATALRALAYRERRVIVGRYGLEGGEILTLNQLAQQFGGLQRERVRQIQLIAETKLAELLEADALREAA